jgi:transposase InsO family protein
MTSEGYCKVLTLVEGVTTNGLAFPLKSKTAEEILDHFIEYCSIFGVPKIIVTDRGGELVNELMKRFCTAVGVDHKVTAPYNARSNGKAERYNNQILNSISIFWYQKF